MSVHACTRIVLLLSLAISSSFGVANDETHPAPKITKKQQTITFLGPGEEGGPTHSILSLALSKADHPDIEYDISIAPEMNQARALKSIKDKAYPNAIRRFEAKESLLNDEFMIPVRFPVYLGVMGYRVCYVNEKNAAAFAATEDINELKQFKYGFKEGWRDIEILKFNNYNVKESVSVTSLYKQLSVNRVDVVCRAVIEIASEHKTVDELGNIVLDKSKIFKYHMPFFFFVHKHHQTLAEQIEQGLINAYNDGSYQQLWEKLYAHHFNKINIENRNVVRLENPLDEHINFTYQKYLPRSLENL